MCGRFVFKLGANDLTRMFELLEDPMVPEPGDINPGQQIPLLLHQKGNYQAKKAKWGLPLGKGKPVVINSRAESLTQKPIYSKVLATGRCLIPATGFYEWRQQDKQQMYYHLPQEQPFCFAGLLWQNINNNGQFASYCSIVTVSANPLVAKVHHRMPAMLTASQYLPWLNAGSTAKMLSLLQPYQHGNLHATLVGSGNGQLLFF